MNVVLEAGDVISDIDIAKNFWRRTLGLFHKKSKLANGLLLYPCNAIHTFFMGRAIDVVFISKSLRIIKISTAVKSNKIRFCMSAYYVLELPAGNSNLYQLKQGDCLVFA